MQPVLSRWSEHREPTPGRICPGEYLYLASKLFCFSAIRFFASGPDCNGSMPGDKSCPVVPPSHRQIFSSMLNPVWSDICLPGKWIPGEFHRWDLLSVDIRRYVLLMFFHLCVDT